jgi:EmrB/QacA subfamily drug resistance transporter
MVHFGAPLSTVQWVVTGYLLSLALVLPSFRWTVERVGPRRLYVFCLVAFTAASALCAGAWSATSLIVFRILQGAVGGLLTPLAQALIAQLAGPARMGRAIAISSIAVLVAPLLGPTLGGLVIEWLSWRWVFLVNAPVGLVGAWLALGYLPAGSTTKRARLDFVGLALLSPGIGLFTYAISLAGRERSFSSGALGILVVAFVLIALFALDAWRRPDTALLDLRLFKRVRLVAALAAYLLTSFGEFGAQLILPLYYQQVRGASALATGLLLAPQGLGMLLTIPTVGKLTDRIDNGKIVVAGVIITLLGTWVLIEATDQTPYWLLSVSLFVRGVGFGATVPPTVSAAYKQLSREEIPNGTTAMNIVQRLGAPLGTAAMAITLHWFESGAAGSPAGSPPARAFAHTFAVSAGFSGLALFAGLVLAGSRTISTSSEG